MRVSRRGETKLLILQTAKQLFAEQGYRMTTLEQIAEQVGITKPAVYRHYLNKQALLEALLQDATEQEEYILSEPSLPLKERLLMLARMYLPEHGGGFNPLMAVMTGSSDKREHMPDAEQHAREHMRHTLNRLEKLFSTEIAKNTITGDPAVLAVTFSSVVHGAQMHMQRKTIAEEKNILEASIELFLRGCQK